MSVPFGNEMFTFAPFLVLINRLMGFAYSAAMIFATGETFRWQAPLWKYLVVSSANVVATFCQYECLRHISFGVQVLGKSFKMTPVMIWSFFLFQKRYPIRDWLIAVVVALGVAMFILMGPVHSEAQMSRNSNVETIEGLLLLAGFIFTDGLTSTMQEKIFGQHKTSKYNQMFYINLWSISTSSLMMVVAKEFQPAIEFGLRHTDFLQDAAEISVAAVVAQHFNYSMIQEFGALVFAATINVRQIVSIVVSYVVHGHSITGSQVMALVAIFGALTYKSYAGLAAASSGGRHALDGARPGKAPKDGPERHAARTAEDLLEKPTKCDKLVKDI